MVYAYLLNSSLENFNDKKLKSDYKKVASNKLQVVVKSFLPKMFFENLIQTEKKL